MRVKQAIKQRTLKEARLIAATGATVREAARRMGVSKSTVHQDVTRRLTEISPAMGERVRKVLDQNKQERHLRGGEATRRRCLNMKK